MLLDTQLQQKQDMVKSLDLLERKSTHFVLWRPGVTNPAPKLFIGLTTQPISQFKEIPLVHAAEFPDLWQIPAADCDLKDGQVYYYWFKVRNTEPYDAGNTNQVLYCTDPMAYTIDRRAIAPVPQDVPPGLTGASNNDPAGVILYQDVKLVPCDPDGRTANWSNDPDPSSLPANNKLVIYELPTRWTRITSRNSIAIGNGTFQDVLALLVSEQKAPTFATVAALNNRAHLVELGINALELLPPADSNQQETWGYGTANFFAASYYLGLPDGKTEPTASFDFSLLINTCHQNGIRFFKDAVMAFCTDMPYRDINYVDFLIKYTRSDDPNHDPEQGGRDGFGGDLIKYRYQVEGYNPITGEKSKIFPSREFMKAYIYHWMDYFRIDGLRLDSVNNIDNYDFLQELKDFSRTFWKHRGGRDDNFLVVGEELSVPLALIEQNRLDGMWNEKFKHIIRSVILGRNWSSEASFEWSVRKMIDCRLLGFRDGSQCVNYITSHDVGGQGNERLYNWLDFAGVYEKEQRAKLAFVCLITAVGIPMILAGDEFVDQMDLDIFSGNVSQGDRDFRKQVDPVNFSRLDDAWRRRVFNYVARLVKFRTTSNALSTNDTNFIHIDFEQGKRVLVWQRGTGDNIVVVVANFSDWGVADAGNPNAQYVIPNFPMLPQGKKWREITQDRDVPWEWAGKEPLFPWEAKVYATI
ncbi:glycoside hydrolase family protein [Calothrix sp. NIES-4071]|nr:glycoside hydrolase family protein [Calothrix sp. NIES-4071]BAZ58110.1 glycoside hydrolase family protein [Calothrix sp. NIES-4105]